MRNSAPIARWRNSQGVLTQSWSATGRFQARALTQEHPARIQRAKPNLFALLLALGFFIPGPLMAGAVMVALALIKERIERHMGSRRGFIAVAVTCAGFGSTLALVAPNNHWLLDGVTGALWGIAVAASSWRAAPRHVDASLRSARLVGSPPGGNPNYAPRTPHE